MCFCFPHFLEHCDFTVDDSSSSNNTVTSISSTDGGISESSSVPSVLFSRDDARRRIKRPAKRPAAAAVSSSSASTTAEAAAVVTPAVQQQSSSQSPSMSSSLYEVITTTRTLYDNVWISSSGSLFEVAKPAKATTTADVKKSKVSRTIYSQCRLGPKYKMKYYNLKKLFYNICTKYLPQMRKSTFRNNFLKGLIY